MTKAKYFKMTAVDNDTAEIYIYGDIVSDDWRWFESDTSAVSFRNALNELGDVSTITVNINSPGGDVFEGIAIYNMLKRHKAKIIVRVDALAASIASVIAMAADELIMPSNTMLMLHNAWTFGWGNHNEFRKLADDLENINESVKESYLAKNPSMDKDELSRIMDAETWISAREAKEMGFADEVIEAVPVAASMSQAFASRFKNVPENLTEPQAEEPAQPNAEIAELKRVVAELTETIKSQQKEEPIDEPKKQAALSKLFLNL